MTVLGYVVGIFALILIVLSTLYRRRFLDSMRKWFQARAASKSTDEAAAKP